MLLVLEVVLLVLEPSLELQFHPQVPLLNQGAYHLRKTASTRDSQSRPDFLRAHPQMQIRSGLLFAVVPCSYAYPPHTYQSPSAHLLGFGPTSFDTQPHHLQAVVPMEPLLVHEEGAATNT